jgi:hypothetical protein
MQGPCQRAFPLGRREAVQPEGRNCLQLLPAGGQIQVPTVTSTPSFRGARAGTRAARNRK